MRPQHNGSWEKLFIATYKGRKGYGVKLANGEYAWGPTMQDLPSLTKQEIRRLANISPEDQATLDEIKQGAQSKMYEWADKARLNWVKKPTPAEPPKQEPQLIKDPIERERFKNFVKEQIAESRRMKEQGKAREAVVAEEKQLVKAKQEPLTNLSQATSPPVKEAVNTLTRTQVKEIAKEAVQTEAKQLLTAKKEKEDAVSQVQQAATVIKAEKRKGRCC